MKRLPVVEGGNAVSTRDGRRAVIFDEPPESVALARWRERKFLDVERQFARQWRDALSTIDMEAIFQQGRDIIRRVGRPKDLVAAKNTAAQLMQNRSSRYVLDALKALKPKQISSTVIDRWESRGAPPITTYAPFTAHILLVDLFFCLSVGADLIGRERQTNKIDIAYLYYLPFCMVFTSRDKIHERTAPLFLQSDQVFVRGGDLKADLAKLDAHYSQLSDEEKLKGVMSFAHYPPVEGDFLISKLWDKLMRPEWREWATRPPVARSAEEDAKIIEALNEIESSPKIPGKPELAHEEIEAMMIKRSIPIFRGKWRMIPPEAEKPRS